MMAKQTVIQEDLITRSLRGKGSQGCLDLGRQEDVIAKDRRKKALGRKKHLALLGGRKEWVEMYL